MESKQIQKAGDNSQQVQMFNPTIVMGIDEKRVREVCSEVALEAIKRYSRESSSTALERINRFTTNLIPRMEKIEKNFNSLSDPSFQALLRKAQITAACTDRENDYSILSELLVHRIKNKGNVKKKASIDKAVEIIDKIDEDSLLALTVFLAMETFTPTSGNILSGLEIISKLYEKFDLEGLPHDNLWMDNLSILGAITITPTPIGSMKKFENYFAESLSGYACAGIKKGSDEYVKSLEILSTCGIGEGYYEENILIDGYVRLPVRNKESIKDLLFDVKFESNGKCLFFKGPISQERFDCLNKVFDMYSRDATAISTAKSNFTKKLHSYLSIHKAIEWWNSIEGSVSLTSVGRAIGHTNARSIDPTLPNLD